MWCMVPDGVIWAVYSGNRVSSLEGADGVRMWVIWYAVLLLILQLTATKFDT